MGRGGDEEGREEVMKRGEEVMKRGEGREESGEERDLAQGHPP